MCLNISGKNKKMIDINICAYCNDVKTPTKDWYLLTIPPIFNQGYCLHCATKLFGDLKIKDLGAEFWCHMCDKDVQMTVLSTLIYIAKTSYRFYTHYTYFCPDCFHYATGWMFKK